MTAGLVSLCVLNRFVLNILKPQRPWSRVRGAQMFRSLPWACEAWPHERGTVIGQIWNRAQGNVNSRMFVIASVFLAGRSMAGRENVHMQF